MQSIGVLGNTLSEQHVCKDWVVTAMLVCLTLLQISDSIYAAEM